MLLDPAPLLSLGTAALVGRDKSPASMKGRTASRDGKCNGKSSLPLALPLLLLLSPPPLLQPEALAAGVETGPAGSTPESCVNRRRASSSECKVLSGECALPEGLPSAAGLETTCGVSTAVCAPETEVQMLLSADFEKAGKGVRGDAAVSKQGVRSIDVAWSADDEAL